MDLEHSRISVSICWMDKGLVLLLQCQRHRTYDRGQGPHCVPEIPPCDSNGQWHLFLVRNSVTFSWKWSSCLASGTPEHGSHCERAKLYRRTLHLQLLSLSHLMQLSFWSPLWAFVFSAGKRRVNKKKVSDVPQHLGSHSQLWKLRPFLRCLCSGIAPSILALRNELSFCLWANTCTLHTLC